MGVSFIGIATKAKESELIDAIKQTNLKNNKPVDIVFESEHYFETVILRKPEDGIIDVYSCDKGTVCTVSYNVYDQYLWKSEISERFNLFYFDVSETSMEHRFAFFALGSEKQGMNVYDEGSSKRIHGDNFLNIRDGDDIFTGIFADAVSEYLPRPFGEMLESQDKMRRYRLVVKPAEHEKKVEAEVKKTSFLQRLFGVSGKN